MQLKFDRVPSDDPPVISGSHTPEDPTAESESLPRKRRKLHDETSSEEDEDSEMELAKLSSRADSPYDVPVASQSGSAAGPSSRTPLEETEILQPVRVLHQTQDTSARGKRRRKKALEAESSTVPETSMSDHFCNQVDQTIHLQRELNEVLRGERGNERLSWARWLGFSSCRIHPDLYDKFIRSATHLLNEYV